MKVPTAQLRDRLREATTAAILDAAEQVAAEEGLPNANLTAIAARAGVAVGTLYNYFEDRDKLIEAMFCRRREQMYDAIDVAAKAHAKAPFEEQLLAFVRSVFEHFDAHRVFKKVALDNEHLRPVIVKGEDGRRRPALQQIHDRAARVLKVGVREKKLRDHDVELLATALVSFMRGFAVSRLEDPRALTPETETVIELFMHGAAR